MIRRLTIQADAFAAVHVDEVVAKLFAGDRHVAVDVRDDPLVAGVGDWGGRGRAGGRDHTLPAGLGGQRIGLHRAEKKADAK